MANDQDHHHVKFDADPDSFPKNAIAVQQMAPTKFQVHLGFLKLNHTYAIQFPLDLPHNLNHIADWIADESCASACGTFMSYEKSTNGGMLNLQIHAKKPKLMSELIRLCSAADHTVHLDIALLARVLGKGQGTPMLKDGIHCIAFENEDEDSEASDWQGFE